MKIIHKYFKESVEKEIAGNAGFMLTDKKGGWFCLWDRPQSRYAGWFVALHQKHYKIIDDIGPSGTVEEIKNNFWSCERRRGSLRETFFLPSGQTALAYELDQQALIEVVLDVKQPYENKEIASYEVVEQSGNCLVVKCSLPGAVPIYLACYGDSPNFFWRGDYFEKHYPLDQQRESPPFSRRVLRAFEYEGRRLICVVDIKKEQAKDAALAVYKNISKLEHIEQGIVKKTLGGLKMGSVSLETQMALRCCHWALAGMGWENNYGVQFYAGLPWFFQFWTRDALISLNEFHYVDHSLAEKVFWHLLRQERSLGYLPKISGDLGHDTGESADSLGWLAVRTAGLKDNKYFKTLSASEIATLKNIFLEAVRDLVKNHTQDGLIACPPSSTWMDSLKRDGLRIEIQALALALFDLAYHLTQNNYYWLLATDLKSRVREHFWNGKTLLDGWRDFTVRPNIFLACYVYPKLLSRHEWIKSFTSILPKIWLEWGGLSTVDTKSLLFHPHHTGESPESYHNGDSWFFMNNIAALIMAKADHHHFRFYIDKVIRASLKEILWQGVVGHHAELSSASALTSQGCWSQAWSAATFSELIRTLDTKQ